MVLAFVFAPVAANAQVSVGVSGGLSLASFSGDSDFADAIDETRTGLTFGGFVSLPVSEIVSITPGLYYAQKGGAFSEDLGMFDPSLSGVDGELTFKLDYLEIPVLFQVGVTETESAAVSVFAGPSLAFESKCELDFSASEGNTSVESTEDCGDADIDTKSVLFNAIFGASVRFMTSDTMFLLANGGLNLGLTSADDSSDDEDVKPSAWFLQAGVGWVVGG